jgi:hypothetical protein
VSEEGLRALAVVVATMTHSTCSRGRKGGGRAGMQGAGFAGGMLVWCGVSLSQFLMLGHWLEVRWSIYSKSFTRSPAVSP